MLFGELEKTESYLYHYTSAARLADILESGVLRLSSYRQTNDPLESRAWQVHLERNGWGHDSWPTVTSDVRERVKILCLTSDSEPADGQSSWLLNRGWARARMWAQYAAAHSGACLILDKSQLQAQFASLRDRTGFGKEGSVTYSDEAFGIGTLVLSADEIDDRGEAAAIQDLVATKSDAIFFKKTLDWQGEREYRFLVTSDREFEALPINEALVGIVIGPEFPNSEISVLQNRFDRMGRPETAVARLDWVDGRPLSKIDWPQRRLQLERLKLSR